MSLKASALKNNDAKKKAINKELKGILAHIDDELKIAHDQGKHEIVVSVPITFSIPYMSNTEAQRIIYYNIISSLLDREFIPSIELKNNATLIHITWLTNEERHEIHVQNALLAKYTKRNIPDINLS